MFFKMKKMKKRGEALNFVLMVITVGVLIIICLYFMYMLLFSENLVAGSINLPITEREIDYDYTEIQEEVIEIAKEYFYFENKYNLSIQNTELGESVLGQWNFHEEDGVGREGISINANYAAYNPNIYKVVFAHEYAHHVLYMMGLEDADTNEALAETFAWYVDKETSGELFGSDNRGHGTSSYEMVMTPILEDDNFDCLNNVFVKDDKIDSIKEYKDRLKKYCNSTI